MKEPSEASSLDPEDWFHTRATHYVVAQIVYAFNQVGVFQHLLGHSETTVREVAQTHHLDEHVFRILVEYLHAVDAVIMLGADDTIGLTDFGKRLLARYGRDDNGQRVFNLFDLRVGAYQPVWGSLEQMLKGTRVYGAEVHRKGGDAAEALYKLASALVQPLQVLVGNLEPATVLEFGPTSGLVQTLGSQSNLRLLGVDRSPVTLTRSADLGKRLNGSDRATWVLANIFEVEAWRGNVEPSGKCLFFSCHFHEFLSVGVEKFSAFIRDLRTHFPGSHVVVFEQPRMDPQMRDKVPNSRWLYAQSNILIHHLIRNALILTESEWVETFVRAGCSHVSTTSTPLLGFSAYTFQL